MPYDYISMGVKRNQLPKKEVYLLGTSLDKRYKKDIDSLLEYIDSAKKHGAKIVLTQGVFDLVHEGHARYLEAARQLGDLLIVGVDSDALTKQRKGPSRPVVPEDERIEMLAHLRHVDAIIKREIHNDINYLIKLVRPDVLVTSSSTHDFPEEVVSSLRNYCGEIVTYPPLGVTSTTARIRQLTIDGAESLAHEINTLTQEFVDRIKNG